MDEPNIFQCHSQKQQDAILTEKRILLLAAGTQWGKTSVGAIRMKEKIHTYTSKDDAFLITSPTYKTLHQSTLPAFLKVMEGYGVYDKKFDTFNIFGGGKVYCRTETDPDSIVGITNVRHIWADEAGKYGKYFWENMQARAEFCGSAIDLTTSPYSINWIFRELIKPHQRGLRPDIEYITAASWDNPYHSLYNPENRKRKEATMDPRRFRMIFGGVFEKMEGLVYDCFDENIHQIEPLKLPEGTKYYGGIDWGYYPDPFVINIRAITPGGMRYKVSEFCKTRLILEEQIKSTKQKMSIYKVERFFADPSQPGAIEAFNRAGIPTVASDNDIRVGIDTHYALLKSNTYKLFKDLNPYTIDEYSMYHYPEEEDLGPDDDQKEQVPVDQHNHIMDTERYISLMTEKRITRHTPKNPSEENKDKTSRDNQKRIEALKKFKKNGNSETWS